MKVYEFYFNPPLKDKEKLESRSIFESFYYEPKNIYEKRMGNFLIVGELKNPLPKNLNFLSILATYIRENYYKKPIINPEKALKNSLNLANELLSNLISKGEVSWLGNLDFFVLAEKDFKIYFAKVGSIRPILIRGNKILDIDQKIKTENLEPQSLKIFGNVVKGKVIDSDVMLIISGEIYDFLESEELFSEILNSLNNLELTLKKVFEERKETTSKLQGILVAVFFSKKEILESKEIITTSSSLEFSFKKIFSFYFQKIKNSFSLPYFRAKKRIALIAGLLFVFLLARIFIAIETKLQARKFVQEMKIIESNLKEAISFLSKQDIVAKQKAQLLLKENVKRISPFLPFLSKFPEDFSKKILEIENTTRSHLLALNNFEEIKDPKEVLRLPSSKFFPEKFLVFEKKFIFFSPYLKNIYFINEEKKELSLELGKKVALGCVMKDLLVFYSKPNHLLIIANDKINELSFSLPFLNPNFGDLACHDFSLYFYDKNSGHIIKYSLLKPGNYFKITEPQILLEKPTVGISLGLNDNIWILQEKSILKFDGKKVEEIVPNIFPEIEQFKKIFVSNLSPTLFILEPPQKRILIFDKSGKIIKQIFSEKFNELLDFWVLEEEKKIFVLNGLVLYEVPF